MKRIHVRYLVTFSLLLVTIVFLIRALVIAYNIDSRLKLEMSSRNNLRLVMLAIESYAGHYGQLPPHAVLDSQGEPIHSWRTLVTPYVAAKPNLYRWDEPWDGPFNTRLAQGLSIYVEAPPVDESGRPIVKSIGPYVGPIDYAWVFRNESAVEDNYRAHFFAVIGDETAWPENRTLSPSEIGDGVANTILLVESHAMKAYWSEPKDLRFDEMDFRLNSLHRVGISGLDGSDPLVLFADGEIFRLNPAITPEVVRALLTANGDEKVYRYQLIEEGWLR